VALTFTFALQTPALQVADEVPAPEIITLCPFSEQVPVTLKVGAVTAFT